MRLKISLYTVAFSVVSKESASHILALSHLFWLIFIWKIEPWYVQLDLVKTLTGENFHSLKFLLVILICIP